MQEVISFLNSEGYYVSDFVPDAKLRRFSIDKEDKKNSGYYVGFRNYLQSTGEEYFTVLYGSWRDTEPKIYSTLKRIPTQLDKKKIDEQIRKAKRAHLQEKKELQDRAANVATETFFEYSDKFGKNEYLEKKGLKELFGARISGFDLKVPMCDIDGNLRNIETITPTGKFGLFGGQRTGLFHHIGEIGEIIYMTEGFSDAATVHMATGECCVATFNAGNLVPVAEALSRKYPGMKIVICGDNDEIGIKKAQEAANVCGGKFVICKGQRDFNDLYLNTSLEEVKKQIEEIKPKEVVEGFDPTYIMHHPYPDENEKTFSRKGTMANVKELLRRLKIIVRYNVISKEEEILIPSHSYSIDNEANATIAHILDWCERVKIPTGNLGSYLTALADMNPYNPVATWIESIPWDGQSRLADLFDTINAPNTTIKDTLLRKWLISAVAALYEPDGVSAHGVLVLQGAQYLGKTMWFKRLVPQHLKVLADGMFLRPDDRDSVFQAVSKWIVELGELDATFRKSDIAQIKAFITKNKDILRRPYAKKESMYARRTVFFGSVNEVDFLKDPTGNRRFWTIECNSIDFNHCVDMQQLWAEVRELYIAGESWYLSNDEVKDLNDHNQTFQTMHPIEEKIEMAFDWKVDYGYEKLSSTEVLNKIGVQNPTNGDCQVAGRALRRLTKSDGKKTMGVKKYLVPPRVGT